MGGSVIVLVLLVVIASFSFITYSANSEKTAKENSKQFEFSTFTSAVCEDKLDSVHCKDEVFVNCDGKISKAADAEECNGMEVEIPKALGFAVFGEDWKDPRN